VAGGFAVAAGGASVCWVTCAALLGPVPSP
jgi:hypothetical protein